MLRKFATRLFLANLLCLFAVANLNAQNWEADADARIEQHRKGDVQIVVLDAEGNPVENANVHVKMLKHEFQFGSAAVASRIVDGSSDNSIYRQKLLENFDHVVFENDLKWPAWIGLWGSSFNWPQTEQAIDWCDANNLPARGHFLSWGTWSGSSAYGDDDNMATLQTRLYNHMADMATTVGNRVYEWDVLNHPIGWLNDTYETRFGPTFYRDVINHARSVVPAGMPLWINEDAILASGSRANEYERIIQLLISQGVVLDGIGFQAHFIDEWGAVQTPEHVYTQLNRFAALNPRLRITELDVDVGNNESYQADLIYDYTKVMFSHPNVEAITYWGFWENSHWRGLAGAWYRADWSEKPVVGAYRGLVYDEWWTDEMGVTDSSGFYSTRAFNGEYEITVEHNGGTHVQTIGLDSTGQSLTVTVPGTIAIYVSQGSQADGSAADLLESDDSDLRIRRSTTDVQSRVELQINSASPVEVPTQFSVTLESSVFVRTTATQSVSLYNYSSGQFEEVDSRNATRFVDSSVTITPTGNLSRFVDPGTCAVLARVVYQSPVARQRFTSHIDQFNWTIE